MKTANKKIRRKPASRHNKKMRRASNGSNSNITIHKLLTEAHTYQENKQLEQASFLYQQVLEHEPENILALNGLGIIAKDAGMLSLAVDFFKSAHAVDPDQITVNKNLGVLYTNLSCFEEAMQHYNHILNIEKDNGEAHGELARLQLQAGDTKLALNHYRSAFKLNPGDPRNFHGLVQLDVESITSENISTIEEYLLKPDLPLEVRCSFYFALGTVYDGCGKYDEAFANYSVANISKGVTFDYRKHTDFISDIIDTFSPQLFSEYAASDLNSNEQPVFIVGMPRSGTTLVEQILATHTDIYAAGELNLISNIIQKLNMSQGQGENHSISLEKCDADLLKNLSRFYVNDINSLAHNDGRRSPRRITDKLPINYMHLGLIALLFPNAHIIHCKRNPLDVSLSCYFQNLAGNHTYASDLKNIAQYYQQYERLMAYWKKVLPLRMHTVNYEEMVSDTEKTSRKLIDFIGLDWQSNCTDLHKTNRHVNTASLAQVREKIYRSSIDRWQHYEKYLHYLKKTLNIFDYEDNATRESIANSKNINNHEKSCSYLH